MCGRFAVTLPPESFREAYGYVETPNFPPRYNIAPTQPVGVVIQDGAARHFRLMRWGFLPGWVKDAKDFPLVINARRESITQKPTFRAAIRRRRCVFLADAFYEWQREGGEKIPFAVRMQSLGPMPLAGVWETWSDPQGGEIDTAAIVTTDANGLVSAIHHRMPVILGKAGLAAWLDPQTHLDAIGALTGPCPDDWLRVDRVSRRVNKVANDDAELLKPVTDDGSSRATRASAREADARRADEHEQEQRQGQAQEAKPRQGSLF
jgi:putative SOS response-associated peptidase YedK